MEQDNGMTRPLHHRLGSASASASLDLVEDQDHLKHLLTKDVRRIAGERTRLDKEEESLRESLRRLAVDEYPALVDGQLKREEAGKALRGSQEALGSLETSLGDLETRLDGFVGQVPTLVKGRRTHALTSTWDGSGGALGTVLDLVLVPSLIATCIQTGFASGLARTTGSIAGVATAIDLVKHVERLAERSDEGPGGAYLRREVVPKVLEQKKEIEKRLFSNLCGKTVKLPQATRTIDLLRRLYSGQAQGATDEDLRTIFVMLRHDALKRALKSKEIARDKLVDPARHLKKYLDLFRESVYDTMTQYRTIFPASNQDTLVQEGYGIILYSAIVMKDFLDVVREHLPMIGSTDETTYDRRHALAKRPSPDLSSQISAMLTLFTQASYCASSFARIGLDFGPILLKIFANHILTILAAHWNKATDVFSSRISSARILASKSGQRVPLPPASEIATFEAPSILAEMEAIKNLTNAVLAGLNALRQMALRESFKDILDLLDDICTRCLRAVNILPKAPDAEYMGQIMAHVLVPFLRHALAQGVYHHETPEPLAGLEAALQVFPREPRNVEPENVSTVAQATTPAGPSHDPEELVKDE